LRQVNRRRVKRLCRLPRAGADRIVRLVHKRDTVAGR
jgi:hypothetical protein